MLMHYAKGVRHVGIGDFRWKQDISILVDFTQEGIEMVAYILDIKNSVPTPMIFSFMRASQMRANDNSAITLSQLVDVVKSCVKKPADSCVIQNPVTLGRGHHRDIEVDPDENGFSEKIFGFQGVQTGNLGKLIHAYKITHNSFKINWLL